MILHYINDSIIFNDYGAIPFAGITFPTVVRLSVFSVFVFPTKPCLYTTHPKIKRRVESMMPIIHLFIKMSVKI